MKLLISALALFLFISNNVQAEESICYGTTSKGRLENSVVLPGAGNNYVSIGKVPELAGRTYVHSEVRDVF